MSKLSLTLRLIENEYIRENFRKILEFFRNEPGLFGFRLVTITETGAVTNKKIPHGLGFLPQDVIQTQKTGAGDITWNHDSFDAQYLDITTTGACQVRALVGTYQEDGASA